MTTGTPRHRGHRARLGLAAALAVAAVVAGPSGAARAATPAEIEITTVPALPDATFELEGTRFTTDAEGTAVVELPSAPEDDSLPPLEIVDDGVADPKREARFSRWWGFSQAGGEFAVRAVFDLYQLVTWSYAEVDGRPIDAAAVSDLIVRSSHGNVHHFTAAEEVWFHALRVVPSIGGLSPKDIEYRVERVVVEGADVVIRNQQRFIPSRQPHWTIELLFFDATFAPTDALLGSPVGAAIDLEYPSGRIIRFPLDAQGGLELRLPRGTYRALVDAPGMRVWTPVALSRDQHTPIPVLTYLDMGLAGATVGLMALVLLLAGRPHLVWRPLRPWRAVRASPPLEQDGR